MNATFRIESAATRFALYAVATFALFVALAVALCVGFVMLARFLTTVPGLLRAGLEMLKVPDATPAVSEVPAVESAPTVDPAAWDYLAAYTPPAVSVAPTFTPVPLPVVEMGTPEPAVSVDPIPFGWGSLDLPTLPMNPKLPTTVTPEPVAVAEVKPAAPKDATVKPKGKDKPTATVKATPKGKPTASKPTVKPATAVARVSAERKPGKAKTSSK